jgi:hypothetical protein
MTSSTLRMEKVTKGTSQDSTLSGDRPEPPPAVRARLRTLCELAVAIGYERGLIGTNHGAVKEREEQAINHKQSDERRKT